MFEMFDKQDDEAEEGSLLSLYDNLLIHDLNTILQNIRTSSELSDRYIDNPKLNYKLKELIETIKQQATRGFRLLSNINKLSQLESSQLDIYEIDVCDLLRKAIGYVKTPLQNNVTFKIDTPFNEYFINANELLQDVFENILVNAVIHNGNSLIEISIKASEIVQGKKRYLQLAISDNGVGIEDARKKIIFDGKKIKVNNGKGLGIGLFLVKKLMGLYKGKIRVEDRVKGDYSQGSNFILLFPKPKKRKT